MQKPKGTYDIYGDRAEEMLYLKKLLEALMDKYNVHYIETPIFEAGQLFHREDFATTDMVNKETYDFKDRGDRLLTLRPEGTAGVVRSIIENKLYINTPLKLWYMGPMFRYERPQAGRHRQFYQFGVEVFGVENAIMDAEVISMASNLFNILGLKGIKVKINTLGDKASRDAYRTALLNYFKPYLNDLCEDCQNRYEKNPLRILDCKVDSDKDIMKNAPKITDYLNEESKKDFEDVKKYLDALNIKYTVSENLVRGLDYYTHTVFEVEADIKDFGSQNVLAGGGRYDNLVESVGGPKMPGVGFAIGIERLLEALHSENIDIKEKKELDVYMFKAEDADSDYVLNLANALRMNGFNIEMDYANKSVKSNFKKEDDLKAKYIIIIGKEEMENNTLTVKNNQTKEEYKVKVEDIINFLDEKLGDKSED